MWNFSKLWLASPASYLLPGVKDLSNVIALKQKLLFRNLDIQNISRNTSNTLINSEYSNKTNKYCWNNKVEQKLSLSI